ncbi:MAG: hypothetical protein PF572_05555 [Patescibacteria group bacterium]|jgi:hypothetical protein|nr:hypothetical protein [Patescibacteria group bacterium]
MFSLKNRVAKSIISLMVFSMFIIPAFLFVPVVSAGDLTAGDLWGNAGIQTNVQTETGLGNRDPREIAASVIRVALGFLGIIAVLIILYAGFLWMTAAGNDDKVSSAKDMMSAGVIGLIIILAAFGIATFVMNALVTATA